MFDSKNEGNENGEGRGEIETHWKFMKCYRNRYTIKIVFIKQFVILCVYVCVRACIGAFRSSY